MMHFPPVSDFPLFSRNFLTFWKISKISPFPDKISHFHPPNFLTTFLLVIDHKFPRLFSRNSTPFYNVLYVYFSPYFDPYFENDIFILDVPGYPESAGHLTIWY